MTCGLFFFFIIWKLYQSIFTQSLCWLAVLFLSNAVEIINLYTSLSIWLFQYVCGSLFSGALSVCLRTSISALNSNAELSNYLPFPTILKGEAVFARCLSSLKDERVQASKLLDGPKMTQFSGNKKAFLEDIRKVSHCACQSAVLKLHIEAGFGCCKPWWGVLVFPFHDKWFLLSAIPLCIV